MTHVVGENGAQNGNAAAEIRYLSMGYLDHGEGKTDFLLTVMCKML
jgi:hypothetical protein